MRLRAVTAETVQAVLCTLPAPLQVHAGAGLWAAAGSIRNRSACGAACGAACSAGLHAGAGVDADANAVINSRKKSEFPLFSSMSFCRLASIAKGG